MRKWTVDECLKVRVKPRKDLNRRGRNKHFNIPRTPFGTIIRDVSLRCVKAQGRLEQTIVEPPPLKEK